MGERLSTPRLEAARRRYYEEMRPTVPGEPMVTMSTSHGPHQIPRRVADAARELTLAKLEALELRRAQERANG